MVRYCLIGIIFILGIAFALLNPEWVAVDLYFHTYHFPLSLLLVIVFGLGLVFGFLSAVFRVKKSKTKIIEKYLQNN